MRRLLAGGVLAAGGRETGAGDVGRSVRKLLAGGLLVTGCGGAGDPGGPLAPAPAGARVGRVEVVSTPTRGNTYLVDEELVFALTPTRGGTTELVGSAWLEFDLGLAREPAAFRPRSGEEHLEFAYRIRRGDHDGDGISVPAGEIVLSSGARLRLGGVDLDRRVPELPADPNHRVFARFRPGERVLLDASLDQPELEFELEGVPGCATVEGITPIVEAALGGEPARAESLFLSGVQLGRCALLASSGEAIFLSAEIAGEGDAVYDLVLVYDGAGASALANWWTLGGFLKEVE